MAQKSTLGLHALTSALRTILAKVGAKGSVRNITGDIAKAGIIGGVTQSTGVIGTIALSTGVTGGTATNKLTGDIWYQE